MTYYLDTSLLISAFTNETATRRSREWLHVHVGAPKIVSWWVEVETAASISIKVREQGLSAAQRLLLADGLKAFIRESLRCVAVDRKHYREAERLASSSSGLRAGDALHLAIALDNRAQVCTLDKGMTRAAVELGVPCILL